jgi:creatinine amidohydrolase
MAMDARELSAALERTVLIEELTWPDAEAAIGAGYRTCVLPSASTEQHGPHLPLCTDAAIAEELATRVARRLGNALVAPVIRPGCSDHHMGFAGSMTIPKELLVDLYTAYASSLAVHGFDTFVLFSAHGGNFGYLDEAGQRIEDEVGQRVVTVPELQEFIEHQDAAVGRFGISAERSGSHAGYAESSEMLIVRPDLVRREREVEGHTGLTDELFDKGMRHYTDNGVLGDARGAEAAHGEAVLARLTDFIVAKVEDKLR